FGTQVVKQSCPGRTDHRGLEHTDQDPTNPSRPQNHHTLYTRANGDPPLRAQVCCTPRQSFYLTLSPSCQMIKHLSIERITTLSVRRFCIARKTSDLAMKNMADWG